MEKIKSFGALVVALVTAGITIWWLVLVAQRLDLAPELGAEGTVVLDEFQRTKDVLIVVLPLFTASIAYFVGSQGTTDAKKDAKEAREQLEAVVDSSAPGILLKAQQDHPGAFRNQSSR